MNSKAIVTIRVEIPDMLNEDDFDSKHKALEQAMEIIDEEGLYGLVGDGYFGIGGDYEFVSLKLEKQNEESKSTSN